MTSFTPATPESELSTWAQYFSPTCVVYLSGVAAPPSNGHNELISATKKLVQVWAMHEMKVEVEVVGQDGNRIVRAMNNHLKVLGQDVPAFKECEVVTFSAKGEIEEYLLYCDSKPIRDIFAKASGGDS